RLHPGHRVRVPFHGRSHTAVVVERGAADGPGTLQPIAELLDPVPALPPALLALTRWAAAETASAWGEAVARALPPPARVAAPAALPPAPPPAAPGALVVGYGRDRGRLVDAAVERAAARDGAVLVLAPEIETARRWGARLARRVAGEVALVTSETPPAARWGTWWASRAGRCRVAVGTRAAAFLP